MISHKNKGQAGTRLTQGAEVRRRLERPSPSPVVPQYSHIVHHDKEDHQHHNLTNITAIKIRVRQAGPGLTQVAAVKGRLQEKALNHSKTYTVSYS